MRLLSRILLLALAFTARAVEGADSFKINFADSNGVFRPLHGINKGPLLPGGIGDLTQAHHALGIPFTRLHDCHWPNPDVVDIHAIFPNFRADPERPENYDFALTDDYIAAVRKTGARIVYRLGESIEHTTTKRFVHPPKDPVQWANVCLGIIRHYNEGWANGFHYGIPYWEIWNEPENRPAMWTGNDEEFLQLYQIAAVAIKKRYPELKVGGPAFGHTGTMVGEEFKPSAFVVRFLKLCRQEDVPLDFFSWHCYTDQPRELAQRARAIRRLLDSHGFTRTESHLNEWNYLPDNSWKGLSRTASGEVRQKFYARMSGAEGAAFVAAALMELQDAPVEMCNLFHGEAGGFGLFNEHGVPMKVYHALHAFRQLLDTPKRVTPQPSEPGRVTLVGGLNREKTAATILLSQRDSSSSELHLEIEGIPWKGPTTQELRIVDSKQNFDPAKRWTQADPVTRITVNLEGAGLALIQLRAATSGDH